MWLIYALGGGWGHLTRAVALARIAQRDRPVRVLTNSPYASLAAGSCELVTFAAGAPAEQIRASARREIAASRPECLIVDTFPRGIGGELAEVLETLAARKVLVHRDLNPGYVAWAQARQFAAAHYDLVLVPGAGEGRQLGDLPTAVETAPWLVRSADEIPGRARVQSTLRLAEHEHRCVLVCASGTPGELEWYGAVVAELVRWDCGVPVRCVAAERPPACPDECWVRHWPAMELYGCAAVVVGGAGYNTVEECGAWGVNLVARPWPRRYDRQEARARRASVGGRVTVVKEAAEAARAALDLMGAAPPGVPAFANGARQAVLLTDALLRRTISRGE